VILGNDAGLALEDFASGIVSSGNHYNVTGLALLLVLLWTALLITTSGMQLSTWYLLAIGGVGML